MVWLEPLVEVVTDLGRIAFGPMEPGDVARLFDAPDSHPKALGLTEELPWMVRQTRLTFARVGVIDPLSLKEYELHHGLKGLKRALSMTPEDVVKEVTDSGLRGRGAQAFRPASSGRPFMTRPAPRNTSSATPMRAIAPPLQTECSWRATLSV